MGPTESVPLPLVFVHGEGMPQLEGVKEEGGSMEAEKRRIYYIGGRSYSPDDATRLCVAAGIMETVTLYRTEKGAFFTVTEGADGSRTAAVLRRPEARDLMDAHPEGIDIANYDAVFGTPARG